MRSEYIFFNPTWVWFQLASPEKSYIKYEAKKPTKLHLWTTYYGRKNRNQEWELSACWEGNLVEDCPLDAQHHGNQLICDRLILSLPLFATGSCYFCAEFLEIHESALTVSLGGLRGLQIQAYTTALQELIRSCYHQTSLYIWLTT